MNIALEPAIADDTETLAALRVAAMRPSLEALGRFDPDRARNRFLDSYTPEDTTVLRCDGALAGFMVLRHRPEDLYLDHLYIAPEFQGRGLGDRLLSAAMERAQSSGLPIRLIALVGSPANGFYRSRGFLPGPDDGLDVPYLWQPRPA